MRNIVYENKNMDMSTTSGQNVSRRPALKKKKRKKKERLNEHTNHKQLRRSQ